MPRTELATAAHPTKEVATLHRYYEAYGFHHVRNADHPISRSTALFERWHGVAPD